MDQSDKSAIVLVVDDDELVRKTLKVLITVLGYQCLSASDGVEAITILESNPCDIVLTDVIMPNMDGLELLQHINENFPDIGVIIATGYSERASYADVIKAGAIDFIKKPIDQAELEAKLERALREKACVNELHRLSLTDSLTSLYNRRAFDKFMHDEVERSSRQGWPLFLALIDIDDFKEYNDSFGHGEGDKLLVELGQILKDCTRDSVDLNFRIGGDEFAVLLPETTADQATEIVQRILLRFIETSFGKTSLSIGVVSCKRDPDMSREENNKRVVKLADQAMYEAKNAGKNNVVCKMK